MTGAAAVGGAVAAGGELIPTQLCREGLPAMSSWGVVLQLICGTSCTGSCTYLYRYKSIYKCMDMYVDVHMQLSMYFH
jgi:hypothetical protein